MVAPSKSLELTTAQYFGALSRLATSKMGDGTQTQAPTGSTYAEYVMPNYCLHYPMMQCVPESNYLV